MRRVASASVGVLAAGSAAGLVLAGAVPVRATRRRGRAAAESEHEHEHEQDADAAADGGAPRDPAIRVAAHRLAAAFVASPTLGREDSAQSQSTVFLTSNEDEEGLKEACEAAGLPASHVIFPPRLRNNATAHSTLLSLVRSAEHSPLILASHEPFFEIQVRSLLEIPRYRVETDASAPNAGHAPSSSSPAITRVRIETPATNAELCERVRRLFPVDRDRPQQPWNDCNAILDQVGVRASNLRELRRVHLANPALDVEQAAQVLRHERQQEVKQLLASEPDDAYRIWAWSVLETLSGGTVRIWPMNPDSLQQADGQHAHLDRCMPLEHIPLLPGTFVPPPPSVYWERDASYERPRDAPPEREHSGAFYDSMRALLHWQERGLLHIVDNTSVQEEPQPAKCSVCADPVLAAAVRELLEGNAHGPDRPEDASFLVNIESARAALFLREDLAVAAHDVRELGLEREALNAKMARHEQLVQATRADGELDREIERRLAHEAVDLASWELSLAGREHELWARMQRLEDDRASSSTVRGAPR